LVARLYFIPESKDVSTDKVNHIIKTIAEADGVGDMGKWRNRREESLYRDAPAPSKQYSVWKYECKRWPITIRGSEPTENSSVKPLPLIQINSVSIWTSCISWWIIQSRLIQRQQGGTRGQEFITQCLGSFGYLCRIIEDQSWERAVFVRLTSTASNLPDSKQCMS
jgi:hypothetical protein